MIVVLSMTDFTFCMAQLGRLQKYAVAPEDVESLHMTLTFADPKLRGEKPPALKRLVKAVNEFRDKELCRSQIDSLWQVMNQKIEEN